MCLKNFEFALTFDQNLKEYVGYGWKSGLTVPTVGAWYKASGERYKECKPSDDVRLELKLGTEETTYTKKYPLGFHIFLDKSDAKNYFTNDEVYKVAFSEVLAFGDNETSNRQTGKCVIANHIYYFPLIQESKDDPWNEEYRKDCNCSSCEEYRIKYCL